MRMIANRWRTWQSLMLVLAVCAVFSLMLLGSVQHLSFVHPFQLAWASVIE